MALITVLITELRPGDMMFFTGNMSGVVESADTLHVCMEVYDSTYITPAIVLHCQPVSVKSWESTFQDLITVSRRGVINTARSTRLKVLVNREQ